MVLFALLSSQSVLRHSMTEEWSDEAFAQGVTDAIQSPEKFAARLFSLRAETLLHGLTQSRARLSGLLIGIELAAAKAYWLGQHVLLVGAPALAQNYAKAVASQGLETRTLDATACTLAGLSRLHAQMSQT